ncbi:hypothetical protein pEaSNUABM55_00266 [Erwinia phage pEa_SNUABM_55]|nr:hypothetical protein pEaSNUABM55_00266 [Erwinia phage pEa_SNUABM_55]
MKNIVKIVDFNRRSTKREDAEKQLADLLDEGYSIAAATDNGDFSSYTLVMRQVDLTFAVDEHIPAVDLLAGQIHTGSPIAPRSTTTSVH